MPSFRPLLATALLASVLLPAGGGAQSSAERVDTTFTFDRGGTVSLSLVSGEITVTATDTDRIRVVATLERGRLETSFSRDRVSVEAHSVSNRLGRGRFELTVPVGTRVRAGAISGDITIRGTGGEVDVNTVSGDIVVEDAARTIEIGTVSGDVTLRRADGRIEIGTVSGSIGADEVSGELDVGAVSAPVDIRRGRIRELRAESVSGSITYDGTFAPQGAYHFNSHSGSVAFALPADAGAQLELETWSGRISSDFPLTLQPDAGFGRRERRMQFTLGAGGARITAETFSGSITIRRLAARPQE